jgi:SAM-dependent methyltransferase
VSQSRWSLLSAVLSWELPPSCERLLDIGCGSGDLAARLVGRVRNFTGIDQDEGCILKAAARHPSSRGYQFLLGSFEDLDSAVGASTFDCAVAILSLHHASDITRTCQSVSRHLRVGGRFIIIDLFGNDCRNLVASVARQVFLDHIRYRDACLRTCREAGWQAVLRFFFWRVGYCLSLSGWKHIREDCARGLPPTLSLWHDALNVALPGGTERVLMGGLLLYAWTRPAA